MSRKYKIKVFSLKCMHYWEINFVWFNLVLFETKYNFLNAIKFYLNLSFTLLFSLKFTFLGFSKFKKCFSS